MRVYTFLKRASATASEHATEDQASDHSHLLHPHRREFELNVSEDPPTSDQLRSIIQYLGVQNVSKVVQGANSEAEAIEKLKQNRENFQRPVVC